MIIRKMLHCFKGSVSVGKIQITNLRYADDVVLIASSMKKLQELVDRVRSESEKSGLLLNPKKTKVMKIQRTAIEVDNTNIKINNEPVENVKEFHLPGCGFHRQL